MNTENTPGWSLRTKRAIESTKDTNFLLLSVFFLATKEVCNNKAVDCVQHRSLSSSWASSMLEFHSSLFLKHAYMGIPHPRCESGPLNLRCPFGKRRWMCLATQAWVTPPSSAKGPRTRFCCAGDLDLLLEDKRELDVSLLAHTMSNLQVLDHAARGAFALDCLRLCMKTCLYLRRICLRLSISADTIRKAPSLSHSLIIYIRFDPGFCVTSVITIYKLYIIYICKY